MVRVFEEESYINYSRNAYNYANGRTWEEKYNKIMDDYYNNCNGTQ